MDYQGEVSLRSWLVHHYYFLLAHKGCGRRCATLVGKGSGSISTSHSGKSELCVQRAGITSGSRQASTSSLWSTWRSPGTILCSPLCPLMLALHAMSFLSGLSGVRHGSGACKLVGGILEDCVDSFCPCGPDAVLVAVGCVVVLQDAWFDSGYMHCRIWKRYRHFLDYLGDDFLPLVSGGLPVFGLYVWSDSGFSLSRQFWRSSDIFSCIFYVKMDLGF